MEKKLPVTLEEIHREWQALGPLRLMLQGEARFGRISDTRRCWRPRPVRPLVGAMVAQEYTYAYAAVSPTDGRLYTLEKHLESALGEMENNAGEVRSIVAWPWIIEALLN